MKQLAEVLGELVRVVGEPGDQRDLVAGVYYVASALERIAEAIREHARRTQ